VGAGGATVFVVALGATVAVGVGFALPDRQRPAVGVVVALGAVLALGVVTEAVGATVGFSAIGVAVTCGHPVGRGPVGSPVGRG
jgi:hypothetical protein